MMVGLLKRKKYKFIGLLMLPLPALSLLLAWYAWQESRSLEWTVFYLLLATVSAYTAIRSFKKNS